jgi:hypothetical protein
MCVNRNFREAFINCFSESTQTDVRYLKVSSSYSYLDNVREEEQVQISHPFIFFGSDDITFSIPLISAISTKGNLLNCFLYFSNNSLMCSTFLVFKTTFKLTNLGSAPNNSSHSSIVGLMTVCKVNCLISLYFDKSSKLLEKKKNNNKEEEQKPEILCTYTPNSKTHNIRSQNITYSFVKHSQ